ncbi:carbon monoxide dehydrogenase [Pseudactinotalea sp. HY160]|uniref:SRPBCC family protein n=1 Tax=Pseudactinotalea sp. HY160 TaxID=2654490 RepID=UPI00128D4467|nr:SRPBCC family protein [Pseudactinotalea sp. HY160]MPV49644.1 carbon monoxide dehydrogenase [Pseudactinotalea sp. HY160]
MDLTHQFTVPAPMAHTWATFNDLEQVVPCFPGAALTSTDGDGFEGSVRVKLGPISMAYKGEGRFVERDEAAGRVVIEASGTDRRGNGVASVTVTATLTAAEEETSVEVLTDMAITGKPAQFGRGIIQRVSDNLLTQFVDCMRQRMSAGNA